MKCDRFLSESKCDTDQSCITIESDSFEGYVKNDRECSGHFTGESSALKRPTLGKNASHRSGEVLCNVSLSCIGAICTSI